MTESKNHGVSNIELTSEMRTSFLSYSLSVILARAVPDVRDGLKPVHRRILYCMVNDENAVQGQPFKKNMRVAGSTNGRYQPTGGCEGSIVTLAAKHTIREPLIEGQGSYGSEDSNTNAAAPRYLECRMSKLGMEMVADLYQDTVEWKPNYDGTLLEPEVLPTRFPTILTTGIQGIAVGMATCIPPHNITECMNALLALADDESISVDRLINEFIPAPDFPKGGLVYGRDDIYKAYTTGHGRCMIRSKYHIEKIKGDKREAIVLTEIPYQVAPDVEITKLATLINEKKIEGISDIRDESDRDGIRIVIDLKKNVSSELIINQVFSMTEFQRSFPINMLAIVNGRPRVCSLKEILTEFLYFRQSVVTRRTNYLNVKAKSREHILLGLKLALDATEDTIRTIRGSKNAEEARTNLIKLLGIDDEQAKAILAITLQRLTGMEIEKIIEELKAIGIEIAYYESILNDHTVLMDVIKAEFREVIEKHGNPRRSEVAQEYSKITREDTIADEEIIVSISRDGYIKRTPTTAYQKQKRGGKGKIGAGTKDADVIEQLMMVKSHDTIVAVSNKGKAYALKGYEIPEASTSAKGKHLANLIGFGSDERVDTFVPVREFAEDEFLFFFTKNGTVKKTRLSEYANIRRNGLIAIDLEESDELVSVRKGKAGQHIVIATDLSMVIRFPEDEVRFTGRSARGVRGIKLIPKDFVVDAEIVDPLPEVESEEDDVMIGDEDTDKIDKEHGCFVTISDKGMGIRCSIHSYRIQGRSGIGSRGMQLSTKSGNIAGFLLVRPEDNIISMTESGMTIRFDPWEIRKTGRRTKGVKVLSLKGSDKIVGVVKVSREEPEEEIVTNPEVTNESN